MVEVHKKEGETTTAMLRRFTRRIQLSGVLMRARKNRFHSQKPTKRLMRERALRRTRKIKEIERLKKMGKWEGGEKK